MSVEQGVVQEQNVLVPPTETTTTQSTGSENLPNKQTHSIEPPKPSILKNPKPGILKNPNPANFTIPAPTMPPINPPSKRGRPRLNRESEVQNTGTKGPIMPIVPINSRLPATQTMGVVPVIPGSNVLQKPNKTAGMSGTKTLTYVNSVSGIASALKILSEELEKLTSRDDTKHDTGNTLRTKSNNAQTYEILEKYMSENVLYGDDAYIKASDLLANFNFITNSDESKISLPRLMEQYMLNHRNIHITKSQATRNGITGTYYFGFTIKHNN